MNNKMYVEEPQFAIYENCINSVIHMEQGLNDPFVLYTFADLTSQVFCFIVHLILETAFPIKIFLHYRIFKIIQFILKMMSDGPLILTTNPKIFVFEVTLLVRHPSSVNNLYKF